MMITKEVVLEALKNVYDPEIGIDIVNLGLIYDLDIDEENNVKIKMTLTTPGCPLGATIEEAVKSVLHTLDNIRNVDVTIVWDPPWNPSMMSEEAKLILGIEE